MHDGPKSSFGVLGRRLKNLIVAEELSQSLPALQRCMLLSRPLPNQVLLKVFKASRHLCGSYGFMILYTDSDLDLIFKESKVIIYSSGDLQCTL